MKPRANDVLLRRNKPWLLLWLLPYLIFGIASGAHNHGIGESDLAVPQNAYASQTAVSLGVLLDQPGFAKTAAHLECPSCRWANHATAMCATPLNLVAQTASSTFFFPSPRAFSARILRIRSIRGPPSL